MSIIKVIMESIIFYKPLYNGCVKLKILYYSFLKVWVRSKMCKHRFKLQQQAQISSKHDQKPKNHLIKLRVTRKQKKNQHQNKKKCCKMSRNQRVATG
jgi:hypothetical protein